MKTPAQQSLTAISQKYFGGKNYNDGYWYEPESNTISGGIKGMVYKTVEKGISKKFGEFEIQSNGFVAKFPSVPDEFIEELNQDTPETPTTESIVEAVYSKVKPKKTRGRPKKVKTPQSNAQPE